MAITSVFTGENLIVVSIYTRRPFERTSDKARGDRQLWNYRRRISTMGISPCCSKQGLNRGSWTKMEDMIPFNYIRSHGDGEWRNLPRKAGLKRCGKSCRLRWTNYLRPDIKRGNISPDEEELIIRMHCLLGNRWSLITGRLPGRTDNEIKNYWNTRLSKKLLSIDDSQSKSTARNLERSSKSPPPPPNHVFKTTPIKITTAVKFSETVGPKRCNGYGRSNCSSAEAIKLCNIKENTNSIPHDDSEHIVFDMTDVNLLETEAGNCTSAIWSLEEERSPHSYYFAVDTATLDESLSELNVLSSPDCNLLYSASGSSTDFELEEFYREAATLATGINDSVFT